MATDLIASARRAVNAPLGVLDDLGDQMRFYIKALAWTPRTLRRYKKETLRLLSEVAFGSGALAVIGGTVGVIAFMSFFTGTEVGLQGYAALNQLGLGPISGFVSERDQIEGSRMEKECEERQRGVGRENGEGLPGGSPEASEKPEECVANPRSIG